MRALWLVRGNLQEHPGGDTTQILRTAEALRERDVSIVLCSDPRPDTSGFDLVHLFHLDRLWENAGWCQHVREVGIPSVLSPIYWPSDEFDRHGRAGFQGLMSRVAGGNPYQSLRIIQRSALPAVTSRDFSGLNRHMFNFRRSASYVLDSVDTVLPNSHAEAAQLKRRFGTRTDCVIVPNAADGETFGPVPGPLGRRTNSVLCVGRIEPRKNQLALIRAVRGTDIQLRIVGQPGRFSQRYAKVCRREAGPNVDFLDWQSPAELSALYQASPVHASVSWYETPGLASLEAALSGCQIVVTSGGSTREYFGDDATYCAPNDIGSIQNAVRRALSRSPGLELSARIRREFSWEAAAERTIDGYNHALKQHIGPHATGGGEDLPFATALRRPARGG